MSGARIVLTGASGYIGKRLAQMAQAEGHSVAILGRHAPDGEAAFFPWILGEPVPQQALAGADAVIHLAHSWSADAEGRGDLNAAASEALARAALAAGVKRFVFASTVSARPTARNAYGQLKYAAEGRLAALPDAEGRVVSARIALVYGGPPAGQYALMRKLTALTPVLPMLGLDNGVQPIHLDEVCRALLTLALNFTLRESNYVVAGEPIPFSRWLKMLRRAQGGGGLLLLPIPLKLVLWACDLFPFLPRERVLGLAGTEPMPGGDSLKALGLTPSEPFDLLRQEQARIAADDEAGALLRYLGAKPVTAKMTRDLGRGLAMAGLGPLGLPRLLVRHPGLIALCEPPANRQNNRLAQALHLAAQIIETHAPARRGGFFRTGVLVARDLLLLPVRLVMARRYQ
jgi:NADH dehydrogenase